MNSINTAPKKRGRPPSATIEQLSPELADQLVDQSLRTLPKGGAESVQWQCPDDDRHIWTAKIYNRTNAKNVTGCPVCAGKKVIAGVNDVATTHPETAALIDDPALRTNLTAFSNKKVTMRCPADSSHTWTSPVARISAGKGGCPYCSGRNAVAGASDLATTHPGLAAELADPSLATQVKAGSGNVEWKCLKDPAHQNWTAAVHARTTHGTGCPSCSGRIIVTGQTDLTTTHPELAAELADTTLASSLSKGSSDLVEWTCSNDSSHTWKAAPYNRIKGVGCPICDSKRVLSGFNDIAHTHPGLIDQLVDPDDAYHHTAGTGTKLKWRCEADPNHVWEAEPHRLLSPRPAGCSSCFKQNRSSGESQLAQIIRSLLPDAKILTSRRDILDTGQELDIVIPELGIALEFNGVYWHSDAVLSSSNYHLEKSRAAQRAGYRLLHIWEDDFFDKRELTIRAIAHRLGAADRLLSALPEADPMIAARRGARALRIAEISGSDARTFWQQNHLQGPVGSNRYFGLVDESDQIAALLGVGRTNHGSRAKPEPGVWDIQRYATCGIVAGGFTRLLKHATQMLRSEGETVTAWTSFSNDDVSDGGMYEAAGFITDKHQAPSYWYIGTRTQWRRVHRSHFTRARFADDPELICQSGWTEREAAQANGLHRVYDAGKTRWIKHLD